MKIQPVWMVVLLVAATALAVCGTVAAMGSEGGMEQIKKGEAMEHATALTPAVHVCPTCEATALKAGKCACGKEMVERHLLGTKDGKAMLCDCPAGCKCDIKGVKDGKCACGKEVKMASCKGLYACPMGCPNLSDKSGKCACGMDMKKCE